MGRLIELNGGKSGADDLLCAFASTVIPQGFLHFLQEETSVRREIIVSLQHCLINETLHHEGSRGK